MAIASYADKYKEYLANKNNPKKNAGTARNYSVNSSDPTADIVLGTLFMNPARIARGVSTATGKEMSEGAKKALGWASMPGAKVEQGFFGAAEGITDFLAGGAAQIAGQKDAAKWIYEHSWSRDAVGADVTDEYVGDAAESKGYQIASDLLSGIGNVGFQVAVGTLIGGALAAPVANGAISQAGARAISFAPLFASASGSGTAENIAKTGELGWRENVGGLLKGGVEVLTEVISPTGKIVDRAINGKSAGSIFRYLSKHAVAKNIIVDFASEAGEEMASYAGGWFIENKLKISDEAFSARDMVYQGVLGGITGAIFAAPSDISLVRSARSSGAKVYAQGDAAVNNKINEGLIEVAALKERGLNNDNVKLAEAALAKLSADDGTLSQSTKEYYLGLAEQMVLKQNLSDQYNALAKDLVEKAKADPATAQSMADAFNALVNEAGGEGKYTAEDFTTENSEAARIYVVAQMANDWLSPSLGENTVNAIMTDRGEEYTGEERQKEAVRNLKDGEVLTYKIGRNAYAIITKQGGTNNYSIAYTTTEQMMYGDGEVMPVHKLSADDILGSGLDGSAMTNEAINTYIDAQREQKAAQEQEKARQAAEEAEKKKDEKPSRSPAKTKKAERAEQRAKAKQAKTDATNAVERIVKKHFAFDKDGQYGTLGDKVKGVVADFMQKLKTAKAEYRDGIALSIADYLIDNVDMLDAMADGVSNEQREQLQILRSYMHRIDLSGLQAEIRHHFDKNNGINAVWGAPKGAKSVAVPPDTLGMELAEYGIQLQGENEADLFIQLVEKYRSLRDAVSEKAQRQSVRDGLSAEELSKLRNTIADEVKAAVGIESAPADVSLSPSEETTESEATTGTEETEAKEATIEDLTSVEKRLIPDLGVDNAEFTKEEWTKARECVPNIDGLSRKGQARVLTLVRTAQANGINEDYMKGLARLSSVYGFGVMFNSEIRSNGMAIRSDGMVIINPRGENATIGHEIWHTIDQTSKDGQAVFRADLVEKIRNLVGAKQFDEAKAEYKRAYEAQFKRAISEAELDGEATASVVGKYLSNMTLLKKIAATDYSLGRGLLAAIRRMKDKWTSAKAFAKENDSTAFAEYRKMTRIERMLMQELAKRDARKAGDTAYSPATAESDSDGNTLSYGQQKFFARSKVRDANGRLLVVYHGTDADFDTFDLSRAGKNGRQEGFGFYFAANQEITRKYGDKQKKVYLNIEKPLYDSRRTVTKAELRKFSNALVDYQVNENGEDWRDTFISNYVDTYSTNRANAISQFVETVWEANENDQDLIYEIANGSGMNYDVDTMEPFYNVLYQSIGYDGNISTWEYVPLSGKKETNTIYVTFRPEQAKYVSNFEPTSNTDLRFSPASAENYSPVSAETDSRYLSLARDPQKNESELRRLVKEAAKAWGAYQENGTPKVLYHGTDADFTVFSKDKTGIGYWFTADKDYATGFGDKTIGVYLNLGRSLDLDTNDGENNFIKIKDALFGRNADEKKVYSQEMQRALLKNGYNSFQFEHSGEKTYIVFNSNQVKSADPVTYDDSGNIIPLSERFNPQNDDIRYSPASDAQHRVVTRVTAPRRGIVDTITNKNGDLSRANVRRAIQNLAESAQIMLTNAQQAIENQLVRMGMTKREAAAWSQWARTARAHGSNAIQVALADMNGKIRARGLMQIIEPFLAKKGEVCDGYDAETGKKITFTAKGGELAGKLYLAFSDYLGLLNAIDREVEGKNPYSSMSADEMKRRVAEYEKNNPNFKKAADELSEYNAAVLDIGVQSGLMSQEFADKLRKMYPHYITMRTMDSTGAGKGAVKGARNIEINRGIKAATESDHRADDPLKSYAEKVQSFVKAAKLNMVYAELYATADGENVIRAEASQERAKELREMEKRFLKDPTAFPDPTELFRKFADEHGKMRNEITFYKDGKAYTMAVSDHIFTGVSDLAGTASSFGDLGIFNFVKKANDIFKKLVTNWNPFFGIKNILRDLQDGSLQTRYSWGEFLNEYRKNAQMMASGKFDERWTLFVASGALEASLVADNNMAYKKSNKAGLEQAEGIIGQFQRVSNFNTLTEALPRFTEFCLTLKHGGTIQQALYNAADVTVNFGRSGKLVRVLNATVMPFLNPAVQGMDRVLRLFTEDGWKNNKALASLLIKAILLAILPMALSNAMYGGDDEYEDMKDSVKENNYLFKVGDTWLKLPRGRVVSTIAGLYNRSSKQLTGKDVDWGDYGKNVLDQITPAQNFIRHIGSPFVDVANNKTWYGSAIESQSLQNYAVKDRYDENTSRVSVWIGQFTSHFGLSPKKVNYLLDQYTGVIGDILLPTTTPAGTRGVVSYNFTVDPNTATNLSNRFYDLYNKTMYAANDGDEEAYYLKRRLDETKNAASELFKEIKTINADSSLSNKEKVQQASAIRAMINQLYKTALQDAKGYSANVKDALAIKNSYGVVQITQSNARQYGLTAADAGKYAVTFGDQVVKLYGSEKEATEYNSDNSKKTVYAEANRLTYGAEYALREYNSNVYEKAQKLNELGISYDEYYNYYMTARYYSGKTKKQKILAYLNGSGLSKSQIALMMYYSGYTAYADEAKKAIKASSLSAERKKELLAGLTN